MVALATAGLTGSLGMLSAEEVSMNKDWGLVVATADGGASHATGGSRVSSNVSEGSRCIAPRGVCESVDSVWSDEV